LKGYKCKKIKLKTPEHNGATNPAKQKSKFKSSHFFDRILLRIFY